MYSSVKEKKNNQSFQPQPEDNGGKKVIPAGSVSVVPFVYLYITQPHCILSNHHNNNISGGKGSVLQPHHYQHQPGGEAATLSATADGERERKLEVSCYDVLVKGASDRHISAGNGFIMFLGKGLQKNFMFTR